MEKDQLKELRKYYHSLQGIKHIIEKISTADLSLPTVTPLLYELKSLEEEFPELSLRKAGYDFKSTLQQADSNKVFNRFGIQSMIEVVLARLEVLIDDQANTPITEHKQFAFIKNAQLKQIIERDYKEIQRAYIADCWKSVIILCGGTIEAILTDLLLADETKSRSAKSAPPKKNDITHWDLADLIDVAVELKLVTAGVEKLSVPIREYRNLIHPGNEMRNKLQFGAEEAKIAVEVLNIVHRDLSIKV